MRQAQHKSEGPNGPAQQPIAETVRKSVVARYHSLAWYMAGDECEADQIVNTTCQLVMTGLARCRLADQVDRYFIEALRERFILGPLTLNRPMFGDVRGIRRGKPRLDEAVLVLPITERLMYLLHYGRGYSHERIGELLGVPAWHSEIGSCLALMRLRELLSLDARAEA